jgi:hypothetical protein
MLSVAEVRSALHVLRAEWYEHLSPDRPFLISKPIHVVSKSGEDRQPSPPLTIAQFACMFDYGQHLKRRHRITYMHSVSSLGV